MRKIIPLLGVLLASSALANPPASALFGQIGADQVAIYAGDSAIGVCIYLEQLKPGQNWYQFTGQMACGVDQAKLDAHGGAAGFIAWILPDINAAFAAQYGSGGGGTVGNQLNTAFTTAFKFTGLGSPALLPK